MNWDRIEGNWKQFKGNFCAALAACGPAFRTTSTFIFTNSIATPGRRSSMLSATSTKATRLSPRGRQSASR
jgi:uncharacterized protein (DUF2147 family)